MHTFYELRVVKPRLRKLRTLLSENQYSGAACEDDEEHQGKKVGSFRDLVALWNCGKVVS